MKHTLLLAAISVFLFAGCGENKTEEQTHDGTHEHGEGTHEHSDGTTHADTVQHHQETFTVDSTVKEEAHDHPHDHDGHDHKH